MTKDIDKILAKIKRNPSDTTEFLLGTICSDVCTIKERQEKIDKKIDENSLAVEKKIAAIQLELDEIKEDRAFSKGKVSGISATVSLAITLLGLIINRLF